MAGTSAAPGSRGSGLNVDWMRATIGRWWLAIWFALVSIPFLVVPVVRGGGLPVDALLYVRAAKLWLEGGDPWSAQVTGLYFAAPPPTLLPLLPFALLPEVPGTVLLSLVTLGAGIATIRMLRLEWWWLLFPPLAQGMLAGNIQTLLVPLLLAPRLAFVAPLAKIYCAVPMAFLGRWRGLLAVGVVLVVTAPFLPWGEYITRFAEINGAFPIQSRMGPTYLQAAIVAPLVAWSFWMVGRQRGAWLVVPALWPFQQWYYSTLVMPARSRLVAAVIATPVPLNGTLALLALAVHLGLERRASRRRSHSTGG